MKRTSNHLLAFLTVCLACAASLQAQITDLASFNGTNGLNANAGLTLSADGRTLYGTTYGGGANSDGNVFSLPVGGGTPTVLASFNGANGEDPFAGLTLSGGALYSTTFIGGANGYGEVFSLPVGGGTPTVLASFNNTNGKGSQSGLTLSGSTFYGTTLFGGANGYGEVFSLPVGGGTPTVLASFNGTTTGANPYSGLTLSADGSTLYGTTAGGGANSDGVVFSVPVGGGTPTILANFNGPNGRFPYFGGLTLIGSTLYGTTVYGGDDDFGTVFSLPVSGGTPTVLASFNGANGEKPFAGVTLSADGSTFYGTTAIGGGNSDGEVFSLPVGGGTPTVLASFNSTNGADPQAGLTLSADGSTLYGTAFEGGANGYGAVFSVPTPEPGSAALLVMGLVVAGVRRQRSLCDI